jgi:glycosyltransferase involved in cell wall biosynthesis
MKIGIDIRSLMDKEYSGVSWCTLFLLTEILQQDRINEYRLFYNSGRDISFRMPKFDQPNVKIIATHYPNKIFNYVLQKICRWPKIDKLLGGVDVFWSPHFNFTALSRDVKQILTVHDLSFQSAPDFFSIRQNFWHRSLDSRGLMRGAKVLVAISGNTKRDIMNATGITADKIKVIFNGVGDDFHRLDPDDKNLPAIKNKYSLPDKFILYLGTIEPRKNVLGLLRAFERLAGKKGFEDHQLVIVGADGWKNSEFYRAVKESKYRSRIKLVGYIENSEKNYYYNLCSVFCYPSFYEGFGLPVVEAMAGGAPVITSDSSSLPEVAGAAALLVDPNDELAITEALELMLCDEGLRKDYSARGIAQAKKFSWKNSAREYIRLFCEKQP